MQKIKKSLFFVVAMLLAVATLSFISIQADAAEVQEEPWKEVMLNLSSDMRTYLKGDKLYFVNGPDYSFNHNISENEELNFDDMGLAGITRFILQDITRYHVEAFDKNNDLVIKITDEKALDFINSGIQLKLSEEKFLDVRKNLFTDNDEVLDEILFNKTSYYRAYIDLKLIDNPTEEQKSENLGLKYLNHLVRLYEFDNGYWYLDKDYVLKNYNEMVLINNILFSDLVLTFNFQLNLLTQKNDVEISYDGKIFEKVKDLEFVKLAREGKLGSDDNEISTAKQNAETLGYTLQLFKGNNGELSIGIYNFVDSHHLGTHKLDEKNEVILDVDGNPILRGDTGYVLTGEGTFRIKDRNFEPKPIDSGFDGFVKNTKTFVEDNAIYFIIGAVVIGVIALGVAFAPKTTKKGKKKGK